MMLRRSVAVAVIALTAGAVAVGLAMRDRSAVHPVAEDDFFVPVSRGVLEGAANPHAQPWSRSYILRNSWQDFSSNGRSLIQVYAGALMANPCTGAVVIERVPYLSRLANPPTGKLQVRRFPGIGPVTVMSSAGNTVRLRSAEGYEGVLEGETGAVNWHAPARRRNLSQAQCNAM